LWGGRGGHCGHPGPARAVHSRTPSLRACFYPRHPLRAYRRCSSCARALLQPTPERAPCVESLCTPTNLHRTPRLAGLCCDPISATCLGPFWQIRAPPSSAACPSPSSATETATVTDFARPPSRLHRPLRVHNLVLNLGVHACVTHSRTRAHHRHCCSRGTHLPRSEYLPRRARREPAKISAPPSSTGCCASSAQRWQAPPQQRPRQRRGHPRPVRTGGTRRGACGAPAQVAVLTERETAAAGQHRNASSANAAATRSSFETRLARAPHLQRRRLPARSSGLFANVLARRPPHLQCDARGTRVLQRVVQLLVDVPLGLQHEACSTRRARGC